MRLPIDPLLPEVVATLRSGSRLVLRAPPGAGKTTRVPATLLDAKLAAEKDVIVLEPRRIAARAAAEFVARERGGTIGGEVGYRVRFEQRGGDGTRLWFLTEGVFSRQLLRDAFLEKVGAVVLDEFHERHLQSDLALGVVRELQETVRPDLKLVVMSATLDTDRFSAFLGDAPVVTSEGRAHPVAIEYDERPSRERLSTRVAAAVTRALHEPGDILVFLPGAGEIRRTSEAIAGLAKAQDLDVVPLHGELPLDAQRRALLPGRKRKVVLSTNVAETALTIEGVTTVIDSGLAREARFDPRHGLNRLEEVRISRASAEQRAGRAGRLGPGRCFRLWTLAEHAERKDRELPEALRLDLSAIVLELRAWGARDSRSFPWLDPPREGALESAERLLAELGAIDAVSRAVSEIGKRMLELSAPPRLARMLVEAERLGVAAEGALLAALASERDVLLERRAVGLDRRAPNPGEAPWPTGRSDLELRLELFRRAEAGRFAPEICRSLGLDPRTVRTVERARRQLAAAVERGRARKRTASEDAILRCVLAGFPDRVVRRRQQGSPRGVMVGRAGVVLDSRSVVREADLFVAVDLDAGPRREQSEAKVRIASAVERSWLEEMVPGAVRTLSEVVFDPGAERVVERQREVYQDLVLRELVRHDVDPELAATKLAEEAKRDPAKALSLGKDEEGLLERMRFLARSMPELEWPTTDDLFARAIDSLSAGRRSFAELRSADLLSELRRLLSARQLRALDREAPDRFQLPSGRFARIVYEPDKPPAVAARIQELFGLSKTPRLASGRVAMVLEILAPNQRPVQVTDDLESFWQRTYPELRKQLRGRYPKHAWPDSP